MWPALAVRETLLDAASGIWARAATGTDSNATAATTENDRPTRRFASLVRTWSLPLSY